MSSDTRHSGSPVGFDGVRRGEAHLDSRRRPGRTRGRRERFAGAYVDPGLVLALVLAALLRLPTLGEQSYWLDEAATLRVLHKPFAAMFPAIVSHESTPPLYYLLAWPWARVFGFSEVGVRSLSALVGLATVWIVHRTAHRLVGRRAALIAALLCAGNPLMVWYSQEARAYALLAFFGALTFHLAAESVDAEGAKRRTRLRWWAWSAVLGLCTHYFAVFYIAPEMVWLLWRRRRDVRGPIAAVVLAACALLPLAIAQRSTGRTDWISGTPLRTRLLHIPEQFATGLSAPHQADLAAVVVLVCVGVVVPAVIGSRRSVRTAVRAGVATLTTGVVAMALLAIAGVDLVLARNALGLLPLAFIALGCGLDELARHRRAAALLAAAAIAGVGLVAVFAVVADPLYQRTDWRAAAGVLMRSGRPHIVVLTSPTAALALSPYVDLRRVTGEHVLTREIDVVGLLLTAQGARRRAATIRLPHGFHRVLRRSWPELAAARYLSTRSREGRVGGAAIEVYEVIPSRETH